MGNTKREMDSESIRLIGVFFSAIIGILLVIYFPPNQVEKVYEFAVDHHETDKKYYVMTMTVTEGEVTAMRKWYGYEGKWIAYDTHRKEGKILGWSKTLDAELRRAIADGRVKEKETIKKKLVDFMLKDRGK